MPTDYSTFDQLIDPAGANKLEGWKLAVFEEFKAKLTDKKRDFPCIFGVEAVERGTLRYGFISDGVGAQAASLARILHLFTGVCRDLGKRTSLVCFFESWNAPRTHADYRERFWQLLQETSAIDDASWPDDVSRALDDPRFEFTFNGQPMFVVVNTDLHQRRHSRNLSRVTITFQPRFVFDDIAEGTPRGDAARTVIRGRLSVYDSASLPENLGSYGDSNNREWKQYYLDDGDTTAIPDSCPFAHF